MKKNDMFVVVCRECGSDQVECLDWVDANTNEVTGSGDILSDDDTWCRDCDGHNGIATLNEWKKENKGKKPLCQGGKRDSA